MIKSAPSNATVEQLVKFALKELNQLGGDNMLVYSFYTMLPEGDIDFLRRAVATAFHRCAGTNWREDTLKYSVIMDNWKNMPQQGCVYDPIISAHFSFVAVCNMDLYTVKSLVNEIQNKVHQYKPALYSAYTLDGAHIDVDELLAESDDEE